MTNLNFLSLGVVIARNYNRIFSRDSLNLIRATASTCSIASQFHLFENRVKLKPISMGCRTSKMVNTKSDSKPATASSAGTKPPSQDDEYVEDVVCNESDIKENEMKVFELKDAGKVLLVRQKGRIHALGTKCTHYGAPLEKSALGDGRLRCQWHGACFNIETGDIEDFPGLDSLPCHQVTVEDSKVKVRAKRAALQNDKRVKPMSKKLKGSDAHFVVIGGGPAGAVCVETLRQENFTGKITLVCKENVLPYDRVKVSKVPNLDIEKNQLRTPQFYADHDIEVLLGVGATSIDVNSREICLENGTKLNYDKVFIATGSKPKLLNVPGCDLKNVLTIRNYEDGKQLSTLLKPETEVVINGSSFIAMETAALCVDKAKSVTVISRSSVPFQNSMGSEIGAAIMKLFESKNVKFYTSTNVSEIKDDGNGNVGSVQLSDGTTLKADVLVFGLGSTFYTDFLRNSGVNLKENGSVDVDEYLKTNNENVYAGGDIAFAPVYTRNNEKASIGHFPLAHYHGKIAALNMIGKSEKLKAVPFFWAKLFGINIRYAGYGNFTDIIYSGNVSDYKFVAFYVDKSDEVVAASSCGMDPIVSQFAEYLYQGKKLYRKDVEKDALSWLPKILPAH